MTTYTERTLGTTTFTERSIGGTVYSERSLGTQAFTERSVGAIAFTERPALGNLYPIINPGTATDDTPPIISNVHAETIATNYIYLDWDTDENANCQVIYTVNSAISTASWSAGAQHAHYIRGNRDYLVGGLIERTTYYFKPISADQYGNGSIGSMYYFRTRAITGDAGLAPVEV